MISTNSKVKKEEFVERKRKILQDVDKITPLKHWIKVHNTNPMLKQDVVIEHLNELHEKYVFVPMDKAASKITVICKKYYVTVI